MFREPLRKRRTFPELVVYCPLILVTRLLSIYCAVDHFLVFSHISMFYSNSLTSEADKY